MALRGTYRQRHPERTPFYQCLEDYWEEFKDSYAYFYEKDYGPLRPVVEKTVERFLDCGIFHQGFALSTRKIPSEWKKARALQSEVIHAEQI
ncbi:hypothetical protein MYX75_03690 [Acidobacteria bacterium AH-259-A15]|nr:hypothetical protein [Acidobacteria bacterium AH-259-A15]